MNDISMYEGLPGFARMTDERILLNDEAQARRRARRSQYSPIRIYIDDWENSDDFIERSGNGAAKVTHFYF